MESIVLRPDKLDVEYDKENDVLYISTGKPREADEPDTATPGQMIVTPGNP